MKQSCKELGQNVTTRVKLYMKAFCSDDSMSATASVSQARVLARSSSKLYQTLKRYQVIYLILIIKYNICLQEKNINVCTIHISNSEMFMCI